VVQDGGNKPLAADKPLVDDADALLAKYDKPEEVPKETPLPVLEGTSPPIPVDFAEVFAAGGVEPAEQECMVKAAELLQNLPSETPTAVKKQIVETSLRVFGFKIETIIKAGVAEMVALDAFLDIGERTAQTWVSDTSLRIAQLQAEIKELHTLMETRLRQQEGQKHTCNAKKLEIQGVLEFFGQDAAYPPDTNS